MGTIATVITALILALIFLLWCAVDFALRLRRDLTPKFAVSFPASGMGIVAAIVRDHVVINGQLAYGPSIRCRYIRIQIDSLSLITIKGCVAGIVGLEKKRDGETDFKTVTLPQTIYLTSAPFDVYPSMPCTIDFLRTDERDKKLGTSPGISWPFILEKELADNGSYRFKITVNGEGVTKSTVIEIIWNGHWDAITGHAIA